MDTRFEREVAERYLALGNRLSDPFGGPARIAAFDFEECHEGRIRLADAGRGSDTAGFVDAALRGLQTGQGEEEFLAAGIAIESQLELSGGLDEVALSTVRLA